MTNGDQFREQRARDVDALSRLSASEGEEGNTDFENLFDRIHGALAESEVAMISVQMDDVLAQEEAQNLPGTVELHPNWRRKCSETMDAIKSDPAFVKLSQIMERNDRNLS